jgi:hypothetical protein
MYLEHVYWPELMVHYLQLLLDDGCHFIDADIIVFAFDN